MCPIFCGKPKMANMPYFSWTERVRESEKKMSKVVLPPSQKNMHFGFGMNFNAKLIK